LLERTIQLQTALDSRILLEQAKGILAECDSITADEAFNRMRAEARTKRIKLHELAAEIVESVTTSADTAID
jgi:AmiR/NasT family two-component response regulator